MAIILSSVYNYHKWSSRTISNGCPRVPHTLPFFGLTKVYRKDSKAFCEEWHAKLGPVFRAHLFGKEVTVVSGHYVREVFLNKHFDFIKGIVKVFDTRLLTDNGSREDFPPEDLREIITKYLTPKLNIYTRRLIKQLKQDVENILGLIEFDNLYPFVQHLIVNASASIFLGEENSQNKLLIDSIKNMVRLVGSEVKQNPWIEPFSPIKKIRMWVIGKTSPVIRSYKEQLINAIKPVVEYRLSEARRNPDWKKPTDVLQDLLENSKPPAHMDLMDYLVCIITILIFVALHSTIENTTVLLYRILENPEIMDELDLEQREVIEQEGLDTNCGSELFTRDILKKFTKLDSVCRETFRMKNQYITLPHEYDGKVPLTLSNGAVINPGDDVLIDVWTNHRYKKETTSVKDADEFRPFRFVNQNKQSTKVGEDYLFFGMGRHACPGRWFAMQEIQAITAILVRECKFIPKGPIIFPTAERSPIPTGRCIIQRK
ncbi:CYP5311 protein [Phycomyces blakesleeanus NRRL 1555(-)]|uniref:CYP5311 protein n=1 Tax=Phycomyces blakesleeanus (strain ATCC 8743b / DSM 1359 / FGSC 10004 / NBRC 33097 / NRRL 1555) TaxID=763407 RepID=A0A162UUM5_PHYB8|nr:CYP5311 protein [Phycomyces blakesleeanus NRRL 1555(-)]OAD78163.1 CYP5311 protein [Phycomyces blakesleeanus NRRL 1555(-)]|eukprot:XP_018296203.1 CYP5311 protein [Phycomyces blakesleeanus NRRL 1555(-)]